HFAQSIDYCTSWQGWCFDELSFLPVLTSLDPKVRRRIFMGVDTRRNFFGRIAAMATFVTGAAKLFSQQSPAATAPATAVGPGQDAPRRSGGDHHSHEGIYYFSGTG